LCQVIAIRVNFDSRAIAGGGEARAICLFSPVRVATTGAAAADNGLALYLNAPPLEAESAHPKAAVSDPFSC